MIRSLTGWVAAFVFVASTLAADSPASSAEKQVKLIGILQSSAPPADKAIACKQLAIYGGADAVPALAALLPDPELSSWARIALEAIPGPAADEALREALTKVQGRLLVGVLNSIGYRRDARAVVPLVDRLTDADAQVACAAAEALGKIGGEAAAKALSKSLPGVPAAVRASVAEGCILCAERFLADGRTADAVSLYDTVRKADVPKQRHVEATRGAILARQAAGLPLFLEQLRSTDKEMFALGLHLARELPGREVTEAVATELKQANADRQGLLVLALADRDDPAAWPAIEAIAKSGSPKARVAAVGVLGRHGAVSGVAVLLDAALDSEAELAHAAKDSLARMPGHEIDGDLSTRLSNATGRSRQLLIELAAQRRIDSALPAIVQSAADADPGVRSAAIAAMGAIGKEPQVADLVALAQKASSPDERQNIEKALVAVSSRSGANGARAVLPLTRSTDPTLRTLALHALAGAGGPDALAAVKSAIDDPDESVQDAAVRTLSTWADNWPEDDGVAEPLLALAKGGKKTQYRVLGLRGYLRYIEEARNLKDDEKVAKVKDLMPLVTRPEEKRSAIAVLNAVPTATGLELLTTLAADEAVAEEAYLGMVTVASRTDLGNLTAERRQQALQTVAEKSRNDATRKKAERALKSLK